MGGRCRRLRSAPGAESRRDIPAVSRRWPFARSSTAWRRREPIRAQWKAPRLEAPRSVKVLGVTGTPRPTVIPLNQSASIIEIRNVDYAINGRPVFAGLDMEIARGRVTAVMGPSGTGKTTLL